MYLHSRMAVSVARVMSISGPGRTRTGRRRKAAGELVCCCGTGGLGDHPIGHVTGDTVWGACHHVIGDAVGSDGVHDIDDDTIDLSIAVKPEWPLLG